MNLITLHIVIKHIWIIISINNYLTWHIIILLAALLCTYLYMFTLIDYCDKQLRSRKLLYLFNLAHQYVHILD